MCNPLDGDMSEFTYTTANIPDCKNLEKWSDLRSNSIS